MKNRNDLMMLRIAQADAYCLATEYIDEKSPTVQAALRFEQYLPHAKYHKQLGSGRYSDDTHMSVAVAQVLLTFDYPFTKEQFADSFVDRFQIDPRKGFAAGFQKLLQSVRSGKELLEQIHPDSDKNGAAMRSVPIGVLPAPEQVMNTAEIQARITHDTPGGVFSSQAVALMSHYLLYSDQPMEKEPILEFCRKFLPGIEKIFNTRWNGKVKEPQVGMKTAHAAFEAAASGGDLIGVLEQIIKWGGDTDTVAAIAWGLASTRMQDDELPEFFDKEFEIGSTYGKSYLEMLGTTLMEKYR